MSGGVPTSFLRVAVQLTGDRGGMTLWTTKEVGNDLISVVSYAMLCNSSRSQATDIEEQVDVLHGVVVRGDAALLYMR